MTDVTTLVPVDSPLPNRVPKADIQIRHSPLSDVQIHLVDNVAKAGELMRWLGERREGPLAFDTESGGLSPWHTDLRLVQVGDLHQGWAIPWERWGGVAQEVVTMWPGKWVMHNRPHDAKFAKVHMGWDVPGDCGDTMVQSGLDDPIRPRGLKFLGGKLVDATATAGEKLLHDGMTKQGWTWATVPIDFAPYWVYGALDTVITAHLEHYFTPRIQATCPDAYDLELGTLGVVTEMMISGLLVDVPYVEAAIIKLRNYSQQARSWLKARHGVTSPMSGGQLQRALNALGHEVTEFTPTGQPKVDKATLMVLRNTGADQLITDLAGTILEVRHAEKLIGTYLESFLEKMDSNHRLHGSISSMGARTHRMTASEPNLQNLPRDDKVVRGAFIPADGHALITCDLSQVEARLAAHFSRDPGLIQAFKDADEHGIDFFCTIASGIFGTQITKDDFRRQITKNVVYTSLFGGGLNKMAQTAGVPVNQMRPVKQNFDTEYPGLGQLTRDIMTESATYPSPRVYLDDGRHLVGDDDRAFTQLTNAKIQGTAATYLKRCLLRMDAQGLGPYLRMVVHDEAILEVPREDASEILHLVQECMTDLDTYLVAMTAEGKIMESRWQK